MGNDRKGGLDQGGIVSKQESKGTVGASFVGCIFQATKQ